ncbi:MAG: oxygen-independent coproporphyrinogen III oxidase [Elioraea tepidiphila]
MSWPYHPDLLATPVPRYTSYPTAAEFHDGVGAPDLDAALAAVPDEAGVSLYIHIPYCEEICWYCGCNTGAANRAHRLASYLEALEAEIERVAGRLGGRGRVRRIAFGGGSPNAIPPEDFLRLVARLRGLFAAGDALLSVELDPRTLTPQWLAALGEARVARASLGVQTLAPKVQQAIGRVQPEAAIRAAVEGLRAAGIASLNVDLMYGLPHQGTAELAATLEAVRAMAPERIALFGYAHVPHLVPRQRRIDAAALPGLPERFAQAAFGHRFFTDAGYVPVGFDHFALPDDPLAAAAQAGRLRRNFQGYTDDDASILIGLGASAISQFPGLLVQNEKNVGRYRMLVSSGRLAGARGTLRSDEDRRRGAVIEALLCRLEADAAALPWQEARARLRPFEERGLVAWHGTRLRITEAGRPYARTVAATFDAWRTPESRPFSNAV